MPANHQILASRFSAVLPRKAGKQFDEHKLRKTFFSPVSAAAIVSAEFPPRSRQTERNCTFFIKKSAAFRIVSKVTEELLEKADKVVVSYIQ